MLEGVDSLSEPLSLPPVDGISASQLYDCFALLVEFAYTGTTEIAPELCPSVWALAASLGFRALKVSRSMMTCVLFTCVHIPAVSCTLYPTGA